MALHRIDSIGLIDVGRRRLGRIVRLLGSPHCELFLILAVAIAACAAVVLQTNYGRPLAQWYVYRAVWFVSLLMLLATSLLLAVWLRWPWNRHQAGMHITHVGALLVITGALLSILVGTEGEIVLTEGDSTDQFTLVDHSQISAVWADRPHDPPYVFAFESGPLDWNDGTQLDLGTVDGMHAQVLKFYQHAVAIESWRADERGTGGPLVRFQLRGLDGDHIEHVLCDQDFGAELFVGPLAIRLQRTGGEAMLASFLNPTARELGEKGLLTMYFQDEVQQATIAEHVGKNVSLGDSGVDVEIVHYLADAKLDSTGEFQPIRNEPRNPLVELLVHMPDEREPYRQVAFAKSPLLNLDGVYDRVCPVKFVYEHPNIKPIPAVELLQDRQGKLFGRVLSNGQCQTKGEITTGSRLDVPGGYTFCVTEYLPHARREISFNSAQATGHASQLQPPAAEVELTVAGMMERAWLQRDNLEFQRQTIATLQGPLQIGLGNASLPLGFSLALVDGLGDTGRASSAAYASIVRLIDENVRLDQQRQISRGVPLHHNGFVVYPSGAREAGHGKQAAVFRVVFNPGRSWTQIGIWLILLGAAIVCFLRTCCSIHLRQQWQLPTAR